MLPFAHRAAAGQALADVLADVLPTVLPGWPAGPAGDPRCVLLGLPRGGVPVAAAAAARLQLPLDVLVVRKLGMPGHPELALGALASGGAQYLNRELIAHLGVTEAQLRALVAAEGAELARREQRYRAGQPPPDLAGQTVLLIDDGLATGASMRAAAMAVRSRQPAVVIAAAPVGPPGISDRLAGVVDRVVLAHTPSPFRAVGAYYRDFSQTSDREVQAALLAGRRRQP